MNPIVVYMGHEVLHHHFPVSWKVSSEHFYLLAMDLWGTVFWILVGLVLYKKRIFISIWPNIYYRYIVISYSCLRKKYIYQHFPCYVELHSVPKNWRLTFRVCYTSQIQGQRMFLDISYDFVLLKVKGESPYQERVKVRLIEGHKCYLSLQNVVIFRE